MKNLYTKDCIPFSIAILLSITCTLDSDKKYSTSYALINVTENIRKALDGGNIGFGVFVCLQKAFDTVDHQILSAKLNQCRIRGVPNDWFISYLSNLSQFVSINGFDSGLAAINCGVPQGSAPGTLLFLSYINNFNQNNNILQVSPPA